MITRKEINVLKSRWKEKGLIVLKPFLLKNESPFNQTEQGLLDFRGIELRGAVNQVDVKNVDLSFSVSTIGQLGGQSNFNNCIFFKMKYEGSLSGRFSNSSFQEVNLSNSTITGSFLSCDFTNANFQKVRASEVVFDKCNFSKTKLKKASFYNCKFIECDFTNANFGGGSLGGSIFDSCNLAHIDLGDTILEGTKGLIQS